VEQSYLVKPIGIIESCYPDKFGTPRQPGLVQESCAFLRLLPEVQPELALDGLAGFSHLWLIFWFHGNHSKKFHAKVHPPRLQGEARGVFATRSPHRPNPVGLSLVEIQSVEKDGIWIRGVDVISGTPVLDIKPYLPVIEARPLAKAGWTTQVPENSIQVQWSPLATEQLGQWQISLQNAGTERGELRTLIEQTLVLDPRPQVYKGYETQDESQSPYRSEHAVRFWNGDVHFRFLTPSSIEVIRIAFGDAEVTSV